MSTHRPMNYKTLQALEKIISQNHLHDQLFKLGLDPEHLTTHHLHARKPLLDLSYVIRIPDEKCVKHFLQLQKNIQAVLGPEQYYTGAAEFHITLYTHAYADQDFQNCEITLGTWNADYEKYCAWAQRQAEAILATHPAWGIIYTGVIITPDAIVAVAEDSGMMQELRKKLVHYGNSYHFYAARDEKTVYPNIIHTTLVRFVKPVTREERIKVYERIRPQLPLVLPLQITEVEFRRFEQYGVFPAEPPIFTTLLRQG